MEKKKASSVKYIIKGCPIALARPRYSKDHVYDSQKAFKLITGITLRNQHGDREMYTGPMHLIVGFFMEIKPRSKRTHNHHYYRPDLDNLIKWICDVPTGILWEDDCIVAKITATKLYDQDPRTEFTLLELD